MKPHEKSVAGTISKDGRLSLFMGELREFFKAWPNTNVIATFRVVDDRQSAPLRGYYFKVVVPEIRRGLWAAGDRMTEKGTEWFLRTISPVMVEESVNEETGEYRQRFRSIPELDNSELREHIEICAQFAAENLHIIINPPKTNLNESR